MVPSVCLSPLRGHVRQALSFTPTLISEKGTDSHTSSDLLKADLRECQCQGHTQGQALYTLQQSMASPAGHKDQSLPVPSALVKLAFSWSILLMTIMREEWVLSHMAQAFSAPTSRPETAPTTPWVTAAQGPESREL